MKKTVNTILGENLKLYTLKKLQSDFPNDTITSSQSANDFIKRFYETDIEIFESAFLLLMNQANITIGYVKISQGGITGTVIDPLLVAKYCIDALAKNVIICHNHPSGNLTPSQSDINITKKIEKSLEFLDVRLLDHLILTKDSYYSLRDNNNF